MPYSGPNDPDLPEHVQKLSEDKRRKWIAVFENVLSDTGDEGRAMAAANAAVKAVSTAVKALDQPGRVGGYLVVWGDEARKDLQGEFFTPDTDLALKWYPTRPILYHHGLDGTLAIKMIGQIDMMRPDAVGVWVEGQLDMRERYEQAIYRLVQEGKLGWSSGSLPHMVQVERNGKINRWPIVEGSLTPTPAETRHTEAVSRKHYSDAAAVSQAYKSAGFDVPGLSIPDDASKGAADKGQAGEGETDAAPSLIRTTLSPMEDTNMGMTDLTAESVQKMVADGIQAALKAKEDADKQAALEAKAARVDALEAENTALKAQKPPEETARRLPGHVEDEGGDEDRPDPAAAKAAKKPLIIVGSKFDSLSAVDMAWALEYMRALEQARHSSIVSDQFVRALAEKTWGAGFRFMDGAGKAMKADELIHTANTGYGAEWIPDVWSGEVWRKARADNVIFNLFPFIEMPTSTVKVRIEGSDPTVFYVPETKNEDQLTIAAATNPIPDSKVGSGVRTLEAGKLALRIGISMEETEDAMIPVIPLYREQAMRVITDSLDNVLLNGDIVTAATGNVNSDDQAPTATNKYLIFDGLRKLALVTNAANKLDAVGAPTRALFNQARFLMPMQHALRPADLAWIVDGNTYSKLLLLPEFSTVDKYGPYATIATGELGRIDNIPVLPSAEYSLTEADGKMSGATPANNTKGQATCVYRRGWMGGFVRRVNANLAYIPYYDAYQMVATVRVAFINFDNEVASVLYNITV